MNRETYNGFVDSLFQYRFAGDLKSERFLKLSADQQGELIERAKTGIVDELRKLTLRIDARDVSLLHSATFHPSNKRYREFFTLQTGVALPNGATATHDAISKWIGAERLQAHASQVEAERARVEGEKSAAESARLAAIVEKIKRDEPIDGDSLIDACRFLGIEVHPRTAGTLRKRVVSINSSTARITGKGLSNEPYRLYRACQGANQ
jgi:hypothetical protein